MLHPGIITAMSFEAQVLAGRPLQAETAFRFRDGWMVLGGIGPLRASAAARMLVSRGADCLMSWGTASGLDPSIPPGALILAASVVGKRGDVFHTDRLFYEQVCRQLQGAPSHIRGVVAESDRIMMSAGDKAILSRATGAIASDMESAAVARAALETGIPFLAVRVVLDSARMALPRCALEVDAYGNIRLSRFAGNLIGRPSEFPDLIALVRGYRKAMSTMKEVGKKFRVSTLESNKGLSKL